MAGDARPFLANGFLGNLYEDFLAFFEKVGNGWQHRALAFGALRLAIVFTILNAALLAWRVRAEDAALTDAR